MPILPPIHLVVADLDSDVVARLHVETKVLYLNTTSPATDQLWAISEAAQVLRTGRSAHARRVRHLRAVTS